MSVPFIPAACVSCGAVFPSAFGALVPGNSTRVYLSGNTETCPHCGGRAQTAEGALEVTNGIVRVLTSSDLTHQMIEALKAATEKAYAERTQPEAFAEVVNRIHPALGELVHRQERNPMMWRFFLATVLAVILKCCNVNVDVDVNRFYDQLVGAPPPAIEANQQEK